MRQVLVVDDEPKIVKLVGSMLKESGLEVQSAGSIKEARLRLESEIFDLLITDVRLPDGSGVELLEHARQHLPRLRVLLITAYGTVSEAVQAMKLGALDYLQKPFELETLRRLVEHSLEAVALEEEVQVLRAQVRTGRAERRMVVASPAMRRAYELIARVAPTPSTVLLLGESGTGKELAAETIHRLGAAPTKQLVRLNCLAIPAELMESELFGHVRGAFTGATEARKGWMELASGGTLFLDEIADLPLGLQGKLLRALEERRITRVGGDREIPVDVRLIAASNVDLRARVAEGRFREDLYYRLNVFPVRLPPLRERREDLPELVEALLAELVKRLGHPGGAIVPAALEVLSAYRWPGNVRELRNVLERALVLSAGDPIGPEHLPEDLLEESTTIVQSGEDGFLAKVESFKAELLREALQTCNGVKKDAAERLGLSPRAMSHYVAKYRLDERL